MIVRAWRMNTRTMNATDTATLIPDANRSSVNSDSIHTEANS